MARLTRPSPEDLSPQQAAVVHEVGGFVPMPLVAWLHSPELARRAQSLGTFVRFQTSLDPRLSELAILVCARHWTSHFEWTAHKALALDAGLPASIVADIAARSEPEFSDDRDAVVHQVAQTLLSSARLSDALYQYAADLLGTQGLVELVGILGHYSLVALTLNAFELGLPESVAPELDDPDAPGPEAK